MKDNLILPEMRSLKNLDRIKNYIEQKKIEKEDEEKTSILMKSVKRASYISRTLESILFDINIHDDDFEESIKLAEKYMDEFDSKKNK